jgi:hypothetical protein
MFLIDSTSKEGQFELLRIEEALLRCVLGLIGHCGCTVWNGGCQYDDVKVVSKQNCEVQRERQLHRIVVPTKVKHVGSQKP